MPAISYTVNGEFFATQRDLEQRVKALLRAYRAPVRLAGADAGLMADLLERHPSAERKIGVGVAGILILSNGKFGQGFYVERIDGTREDFSYKQCIRPLTHASKCKFAFRRAIDDQVLAVKAAVFHRDDLALPCPITGEPMVWETAHVDHEPPRTFAALLEQYMRSRGVTFDAIALEEAPGGIGKILPARLARDWAVWHEERAVLRVISAEANLRLVR